MSLNPLDIVKKYFHEAEKLSLKYPNAAVISTCVRNRPNSRCVLIKEINNQGLIFYTNYDSQKGKELQKNPRVSLVFFWEKLEIQIRIRGIVEKVSEEKSKEYFKTRPKESQITAYISKQSQKIESYEKLEQIFKEYLERFKDKEVEKPSNWGGFLIKPLEIEIWEEKPFRLHKRTLFRKHRNKWYKEYLYP